MPLRGKYLFVYKLYYLFVKALSLKSSGREVFFFSFQWSYEHLRIIKPHFLDEISRGQVLLYHGESHRLTFLANLLWGLGNSPLQACVSDKGMEELTVLIFYDFSAFLQSLARV